MERKTSPPSPEEAQMDLLYLTLSDGEEGGKVLVPYFVPGRWKDLVGEEKERAKALGGTGRVLRKSEEGLGVTCRRSRPSLGDDLWT